MQIWLFQKALIMMFTKQLDWQQQRVSEDIYYQDGSSNPYTHEKVDESHLPNAEETKIVNQAIQAKKDFGIMIGTLVSYPLCFGDLEKYADFVEEVAQDSQDIKCQ